MDQRQEKLLMQMGKTNAAHDVFYQYSIEKAELEQREQLESLMMQPTEDDEEL